MFQQGEATTKGRDAKVGIVENTFARYLPHPVPYRHPATHVEVTG